MEAHSRSPRVQLRGPALQPRAWALLVLLALCAATLVAAQPGVTPAPPASDGGQSTPGPDASAPAAPTNSVPGGTPSTGKNKRKLGNVLRDLPGIGEALHAAAGLGSPISDPWGSVRALTKLAGLAARLGGIDLGTLDGDEEADEAAAAGAEEMLAAAALKRNPVASPAEWEAAMNPANYWSLSRPPPLVVPIDLTVVPVGMPVGTKLLETWLAQLEHKLPHSLVDLDNRTGSASPHVSYRYRTTLVEPGPELEAAVNAQLRATLRPAGTDPFGRETLYADAEGMEALLESFVDALSASKPHGGYFLFLMNSHGLESAASEQQQQQQQQQTDRGTTTLDDSAKPAAQQRVYGYRYGLNDADLDKALQDSEVSRLLERHLAVRARTEAAATLPFRPVRASHFGHAHRAWRANTAAPVAVLPAAEATKTWADSWTGPTAMAKLAPEEVVMAQLKASPESSRRVMRDLVRRKFHPSQPGQDAGTGKARADSEGSDGAAVRTSCLTETWVGHGRVAWLDIGAGPFEWGPTVGGRGVKTHHTFARAPMLHSGATNAAAAVREAEESDNYAVTLERIRAESVTFVRERELMQGVLSMACPAGSPRTHRCDRLEQRIAAIREYLAIMLPVIEAEDDAVATVQLREALPELLPARKQLLDRLMMSREQEEHHEGTGLGGEAQLTLMPRLLTAVSDFMSHVVTPPSALPIPVAPPGDMDLGMDALTTVRNHQSPSVMTKHVCDSYTSPLAILSTAITRVNIRLLIVRVQDEFNPIGPEYLDIAELRSELEQFRFGHQRVTFGVHNIALKHEPSLAMAYTAALRVAKVPVLTPARRFSVTERMYVDSRTVSNQLKMFVEGRSHSHDSSVLEVPIVLFSVHGETPMFIDKRFLARSTCGMVIAVQSQHPAVPAGMGCNGATCTMDLRNPVSHIVSAALQVLGGAVPLQLGAGPEGKLQHSWLWATGPSVLSRFSSSHVVTEFTRDAVHRNELIRQMTAAWLMIDAGVRALEKATTSRRNAGEVNLRIWHTMVVLRRDAQRAWAGTAEHMELMRFDDAADHGRSMADAARRFYVDAVVAAQLLRRKQCEADRAVAKVVAAPPPSAPVFSGSTMLLALLGAVSVVLYAVLRPQKKTVKAHLN